VVRTLRATLGLAHDEPAPGELAAWIRRSLPAQVEALDSGAWLAWCLAGLPLFGGAFPALREIRNEGTRVTIALAMLREHGNLSAAARLIGSSRKVLRDNLRVVGLYPWPSDPKDDQDEHLGHDDESYGDGGA